MHVYLLGRRYKFEWVFEKHTAKWLFSSHNVQNNSAITLICFGHNIYEDENVSFLLQTLSCVYMKLLVGVYVIFQIQF